MVNLSDLSAVDMGKILKIRRKIEVLEQQMANVIKQAEKKAPSVSVSVRHMRLPRNAQPSLREMISKILQKAGKPISVSDIYEASISSGYQWRSKEPVNALNVKMYTDKTFKKVAPGKFILSKPAT
jgi:hypothetical protein